MFSIIIREMLTGHPPEPHRRGGPPIVYDPIMGQWFEVPALETVDPDAPATVDAPAANERARELQELAAGPRSPRGRPATPAAPQRLAPRRCPCGSLQVYRPYTAPAAGAALGEWVCYDCSRVVVEQAAPPA